MQVLPCHSTPTQLRQRANGVTHSTSLTGTRLRSAKKSAARVCNRKVISPRAQAVQVDEASSKVQNGAVNTAHSAEPWVAKEVMSKTVLGIILGGGAGTRLYPLTKKRAKPAVPLGAQYRLIDIPVSNCINSGVNKIYCLTQFNSASLNRHMSQAYNAGGVGSNKGFVEVLAASQSAQNKNWFQGTADAVRQYMWLFEEAMREGCEDFLILSGDHLYRMDYSKFVAKHRASGATITIAALPCDEKRASAFGLMKIDGEGRVVEFAEKPKGEALKRMQCDTRVLGVSEEKVAGNPYIASMGIYVMKASALKQLLQDDLPEANDFGNEIIPAAKDAGMRIQAYAFEGYWEDIGTIEAFYNTNIALTKNDPNSFSLYSQNPDETLYTMSRFLPPSKVMNSDIVDSIIGDGCFIKDNATVRNSVVGLRSLIGANCVVEDTLMMGADYYETVEECRNVLGCLPIGLGDNSIVRKAIIDKNARIGEGCQIINKEGVMEANREEDGWIIKDGIIVVCKDSTIAPGTII